MRLSLKDYQNESIEMVIHALSTTPQFWLNLGNAYDLGRTHVKRGDQTAQSRGREAGRIYLRPRRISLFGRTNRYVREAIHVFVYQVSLGDCPKRC